jgi:hypothetical protein
MAELKTKATKASVAGFLAAIKDEEMRRDSQTLARLMKQATKATPKMWGPSIVGFGSHTYRYASGRQVDWFPIGFSPRKSAITLYLMGGWAPHAALLRKLGKHKTGKGCLYIKRLDDVDIGVLGDLISDSLRKARQLAK